jgi:hypothetical protein
MYRAAKILDLWDQDLDGKEGGREAGWEGGREGTFSVYINIIASDHTPSFPPSFPPTGFINKLARLPLLTQPGTEWRYSVGFDILGM